MISGPDGVACALRGALELSRHGIPCFPCSDRKRPTTPQGFKDAVCDADGVRALWEQYPGVLLAVPTGEVSGLAVIDIDARHGGGIWFARHRHLLPQTRVHRTRSGGLHLFFQHRPDLRCSAGRIAAGVDVRASGGYVIWWPAAGCDVLSEIPAAPWPDWLRAQLSLSSRPPTPRVMVPDDLTLMRLVRLIAGGRPGERNNLTFWAACRVGEMVASGLLKADTAAAVIAEAGMRTGLSFAEAERTAWSGIRTGGGRAHA